MEASSNYKGNRMLNRANHWDHSKLSSSINSDCNLLDNVQFIYELVLANLELKSLGAICEIDTLFRNFKILHASDYSSLLKRVAYCKNIGQKHTDYFEILKANRTKSINQYLTHWIYPYKGKFHPQMIRSLINIIGLKENDILLDPFVGSGTTLIEAQLLGVNCIGIDISPLCVLIGKVKTNITGISSKIHLFLNEFDLNKQSFDIQTINKLIYSIDENDLTNFFTLAKLVSISDNTRRNRNLSDSFKSNVHNMLLSIEDFEILQKELSINLGRTYSCQADARILPLLDESIDGVITSPPYSIALDYVSNDAHSLKQFGCELDKEKNNYIGVRGKGSERISLYNQDINLVLKEIYRVLKKYKYAVIIVGNATYNGVEINTVEYICSLSESIGFKNIININKIIFGLYNVMLKENILILQKG
jgi:tRNA G10  N-methylase Trm11